MSLSVAMATFVDFSLLKLFLLQTILILDMLKYDMEEYGIDGYGYHTDDDDFRTTRVVI